MKKEITIKLIAKPDKIIIRKKNYNLLHEHRCKNAYKILVYPIMHKKVIHYA